MIRPIKKYRGLAYRIVKTKHTGFYQVYLFTEVGQIEGEMYSRPYIQLKQADAVARCHIDDLVESK